MGGSPIRALVSYLWRTTTFRARDLSIIRIDMTSPFYLFIFAATRSFALRARGL